MKPPTRLATYFLNFLSSLKSFILAALDYGFKHLTTTHLWTLYALERYTPVLDSTTIEILLAFNVLLALFTLIHLSRPSLLTESPWLGQVYRWLDSAYRAGVYLLLLHWLQFEYLGLVIEVFNVLPDLLLVYALSLISLGLLLSYLRAPKWVMSRLIILAVGSFHAPMVVLFTCALCIVMPPVISPEVVALLVILW